MIEKWGNRKPEIGSREYCPKNNYRKNQKTSSNKKGIHFSISRNTILKRNLKIISLKIISQKITQKKINHKKISNLQILQKEDLPEKDLPKISLP